MAGLLLHINRKTGVAHVDRSCEAIASLPACTLRLELFDPNRPRRRCSRCWSDDRPRLRASAGGPASVTERSEGNPRRGLTGGGTTATHATERAAVGDALGVDGNDPVDDDRDIERRGPLARCRPGVPSRVTPQIDNEVAEAVDDFGVLLEIRCGLHIADDPEPFRHAIELAQCFFQRREDGKPGQPSGLMSLLERDILADDPLHQGRSAVEGAVACDVGEAAMQLDWLEASEARHRRGKSDFELG